MKKYLSLVFLVAFFSACKQEKIVPLYPQEEIPIKDIKVEVTSNIPPSTIEKNAFTQLTQFGTWIPVIGGVLTTLVEFPVNLTLAIFPPLSSVSNPELPPNASWTNPEFLESVKSIQLTQGSIRITPKELRPNYSAEICPGFPLPVECPDTEFDDFLSDIRVYLTFKKDPQNPLPQQEFLLGRAQVSKDYDKKTKTLKFNMTGFNLRPFMDKYDKFEAKIVATGKPPAHKVYMDGRLNVGLLLKLTQ